MPETNVDADSLIQQLHQRPFQSVVAVTGGGASAVSQLLEVPGASRTLLEALVPYSESALKAFLGAVPVQYCSAETARSMAVSAFFRVRQLAASSDSISVGLAATCSLATDRVKQGEHRIFVSSQTACSTHVWSLNLVKQLRTRSQEEELAGRLLLNLLARTVGLDTELALTLHEYEEVMKLDAPASPVWSQLFTDQVQAVVVEQGQVFSRQSVLAGSTILPGAFNPLHQGHRQMKAYAEQLLGKPVFYELSIANVDKLPLDFIEITRRVQQFEGNLLLTHLPTFVDKIAVFPESTFVVGVDTLLRIADPKYYSGDLRQRDAAIRFIADRGGRFLVFGRAEQSGFLTLSAAAPQLPQMLLSLCREVLEQDFRVDLSSTKLRSEER